MELETLLKQYENTLTQYTQLNSEYLTYIKNTNDASLSNDLITVDNSEYTGTTSSEIKTDDVLLLHHQEIIPVDCILSKGKAEIDYSFITGESESHFVKIKTHVLFMGTHFKNLNNL